jgi:hypothetical protein
MRLVVPFPPLDRRMLLASLATLPLLPATIIPASAQAASSPLPSWTEGAAKTSITEFVTRVTAQGSQEFVPVNQRIATFDNDGTLWCEQPMYTQLAFALGRVKTLRVSIRIGRTSNPLRRYSKET